MNIEPTNWLTTRIVSFLAQVTPKCHDMTRLISQEQDRPMPWLTRVKMRMHYWICVWCLRYRDQLKFVRRALLICPGEPVIHEVAVLPSEVKERLRQRIKRAGDSEREGGSS